jgi:3'-phosphoadenosine 5'-phosphosulfate sulfotransferase (PAPS reductase)/FAD synthetase
MEQWQLNQRQSLPLEVKIELTKKKIIEWYEHWDGMVYVGFSGGKDSTVLLQLVRELYPEVPAVFCDTGLEYPEIRDFVKTIENVIWVKPKLSFVKIIKKYGFPIISKEQASYIQEYRDSKSEKLKDIRWNGNKSGRGKISKKWRFLINAPFKISDKCCDYMKKEPSHRYEKETGRKAYIGIMAQESSKRTQDYKKYGCNAFETKRPLSRPIGFWREKDILLYLRKYKIPFASIYGDIIIQNGKLKTTGCDRTGCMFCMFGCHLEKDPNKFQKMKVTHPEIYDYCMNKLGLGYVLDYIGIKY